jgi:hypothetical protein
MRTQSHSLIKPLHLSLVPVASIHLFLFLLRRARCLQNGSPALCSSAAVRKKRTFSSTRGVSIHSRVSLFTAKDAADFIFSRNYFCTLNTRRMNPCFCIERKGVTKCIHKKLLPVIISTRRKNLRLA